MGVVEQETSFVRGIVSLDDAITQCGEYIVRHATGRDRYGWGYCHEAAKCAKELAVARKTLVDSLGPLAFKPTVKRGPLP